MSSVWRRCAGWFRALPLRRDAGHGWVEPGNDITRMILAGPVALPALGAPLAAFNAADFVTVEPAVAEQPVAAPAPPPAARVPEPEAPAANEEALEYAEPSVEPAEPAAAPAQDPIPFPGRAA